MTVFFLGCCRDLRSLGRKRCWAFLRIVSHFPAFGLLFRPRTESGCSHSARWWTKLKRKKGIKWPGKNSSRTVGTVYICTKKGRRLGYLQWPPGSSGSTSSARYAARPHPPARTWTCLSRWWTPTHKVATRWPHFHIEYCSKTSKGRVTIPVVLDRARRTKIN